MEEQIIDGGGKDCFKCRILFDKFAPGHYRLIDYYEPATLLTDCFVCYNHARHALFSGKKGWVQIWKPLTRKDFGEQKKKMDNKHKYCMWCKGDKDIADEYAVYHKGTEFWPACDRHAQEKVIDSHEVWKKVTKDDFPSQERVEPMPKLQTPSEERQPNETL
jgi:hypothetical protein